MKTLFTGKAIGNVMLLTTALLWGSSYSYRKMGLEFMTPFFFNFLRFFVAFLFLLILLIFYRKFTKEGKKPIDFKTHLKGGFYSGTAVAFGAAIQQ